MTKNIFTIGYEGVTPNAVLHALKTHHATMLVDVRAVPLSRKPGFSKNGLRVFMEENGIQYRHYRDLGTPPEGREAVKKGNIPKMHAVFAAQMATPGAQEALQDIAALMQEHRICLLCFEADPATCHRTLVAEALQQKTGSTVIPLHASL